MSKAFDECRQEGYLRLRPSHGSNLSSSFFLFLFYILFGRFTEIVREMLCLHLFGLILSMTIKAQEPSRASSYEKDDKSEIIYRTYSKHQIKFVVGWYL